MALSQNQNKLHVVVTRKKVPVQFSTHASFRPIKISLDIALEPSQHLFTTITITESCLSKIYFGNRLLNWPKLLRLYADGFSNIFVHECVPYIIPHMFQ